MKLLITSIFLSVILNACRQKETQQFEFRNVGKMSQSLFIEMVDRDIFLKNLADSLQINKLTIAIRVDTNVDYSTFIPNENGGSITFGREKDLLKYDAVIEELFHAYQHLYYEKNGTNRMPPLSNLEYEAKLFRNLALIWQDKPIAETPSQKGLLDVVTYIYHNQVIIETGILDAEGKKLYSEHLRIFQQHWQLRDSQEGFKTGYSDTIDDAIFPDACLAFLSGILRTR